MVQYIHTPWRDQEELLRVRQQFYPAPLPPCTSAKPNNSNIATPTTDDLRDDEDADGPGRPSAALVAQALEAERRQQNAVSRVSMWMQRGGCPHLVESTALLTAAVLSDLHESRTRANSSSYAIRAAYSAAFSRFVTGLLDGQQDKLRKLSMYSIAKTIGLPATFVELRHQATHEQLPSLQKLRSAASNALAWIWSYYWKDLATAAPLASASAAASAAATATNNGNAGDGAVAQTDSRKELLISYLRERDETVKAGLAQQFCTWRKDALLLLLDDISETSAEPRVILRALHLSRAILDGSFALSSGEENQEEATEDTQVGRVDQPAAEVPEEASEQAGGWTRYQGTWTPKPIGVV